MFKRFVALYALLLLVGIMVIMARPSRHDYSLYEIQWEMIVDGSNPWADIKYPNAYGPLYNLFAWPHQWHPKLPHLIFFMAWMIMQWFLMRPILLKEKLKHYRYPLLVLFVLNPFFLFMVWRYGANDSFLAALTLLGMSFYLDEKLRIAGICMALAVFFKFLPLFLLPFLALGQRKIKWDFVMAFVVSATGLFALSWLAWGEQVLQPILFAGERPSTVFSVFRFLRGNYSPTPNLDYLSLPLMITALVLVFYAHWKKSLNPLLVSLLALSVVIQFYKVGHPQFLFTLFAGLLLVIGNTKDPSVLGKPFLISGVVFLLWISFWTLVYAVTTFLGEWKIIREFVGLPTFLLHGWFNWRLWQLTIKNEWRLDRDNISAAPG